jgi:hypothetical protein
MNSRYSYFRQLIRKYEGKLIELKPESYFKFYLSNGSDIEVFFKEEDKNLETYRIRDGLVRPLRKLYLIAFFAPNSAFLRKKKNKMILLNCG